MSITKENIEPCEICSMKFNKQMCKIANKFFQDGNPCFCKAIKKVEKLINENNQLKRSNGDYFSYLVDRDDFLSDFLEWQEENSSKA